MRVSMCDVFLSVLPLSPEALSFSSVFIIWFSVSLRRSPVFSSGLRRSPVLWARSLVWIKTLACGAGDLGFKSPRARHH